MNAARQLPLRIARYVLLAELAKGGMATVFLGRIVGDGGFSRAVAIKRLHTHLAGLDESVRRFLDEARIASRVRHPNVVPTLDVVENDGEVFLIMEFVLGQSLAELLKKQVKLPLPITSAILVGALRGLEAAHTATSPTGEPLDLVHRDFSPQNVIVAADGLPRVVDFGIAKAAFRLQQTETLSVRGKIAYMAPEQLKRRAVDRRADLWAAGVVLWESLTGERLFATTDDAESTLAAVLTEELRSPREKRPEVDDALERVTMRALSRDPGGRFASAAEMADALEAAAPPASARELAAWLEEVARPSLDELRAVLREVEAAAISTSEASSVRSLAVAATAGDETRSDVVTASGPRETRARKGASASWMVPTALAAVAVVALSGFAVRARLGTPAAPSLAEVPPSSPSVSASAPAALATSAAEPAPATPAATSAARSIAAPSPKVGVRAPPKVAASAAPALASATTEPAGPSPCAVPYTIDARGIRKPKPDCLR